MIELSEIRTEDRTDPEGLIKRALNIAFSYGSIDGSHHKAWVIDQMVRCLTACPHEDATSKNSRGYEYHHSVLEKSDQYLAWIADHNAGDDGPETYSWDEGTPP